jgi:hypothetical protein
MRNWFAGVLLAVLAFFPACNKSAKPTQSSSKPADAVLEKLQDLAGTGATDCGRPQSQAQAEVQPASDCAMKAAQAKQAFYVAYDLPGMTVAMAGDSQGKLYSVQSQSNGGVQSTPCPSEIRLAQSGRVTCFAPGSMGGGAGTTPHGGMEMPSASGANPHQGTAVPSHANPHGTKEQKP